MHLLEYNTKYYYLGIKYIFHYCYSSIIEYYIIFTNKDKFLINKVYYS